MVDSSSARSVRVPPDAARVQDHDRLGGAAVIQLRGQDDLDGRADGNQEHEGEDRGQHDRARGAG